MSGVVEQYVGMLLELGFAWAFDGSGNAEPVVELPKVALTSSNLSGKTRYRTSECYTHNLAFRKVAWGWQR